MRKLVILAAVGFVCVSCSSKHETSLTSSTPAATANCQDRTLPTPTPLETVPNTKPTISIPDGPPPCKLVIEDIHVGDGTTATAASTVTVQYVGVSWSNKQEFDASWDRGQPYTTPLNQVVAGWTQGIPGMKVGGRRELIIPPALGYGDAAQGSIKPNETLVFIVDLVKVDSAP